MIRTKVLQTRARLGWNELRMRVRRTERATKLEKRFRLFLKVGRGFSKTFLDLLNGKKLFQEVLKSFQQIPLLESGIFFTSKRIEDYLQPSFFNSL